jgi:hypothetical protein
MNILPQFIGTAELAMHVIARSVPGAWLVLLVTKSHEPRAAARVAQEIELMGGAAVTRIEPRDALEFARHLHEARSGPIVVSAVDDFPEDEWARLDRLRTQLEHDGCIVLVVSEAAFGRVMRAAPNLASWLGGFVQRWDPTAELLSPEEKEERLKALREWSGRSDRDVIELAEQGELPVDPEYAEWLVLLGRGDLLGR